jgi:hypothetical protein
VSGVFIKNFTGDGFVQTGKSDVSVSDVHVFACDGFGFNIHQDGVYSNCEAGSSGIDGFLIHQGSNRLVSCKSYFSGAKLVSSRIAGATLLSVTPPANAWDGGNVSGLSFSLVNGFGSGFHWTNISGSTQSNNNSGGSYSALGAQDNARNGFYVQGTKQTLDGVEADSNNNCGTTGGGVPNGTYAGVEVAGATNVVTGFSWDRAANVNHQGAALRIVSSSGTNTKNRIQLGFTGTLNDASNMPPLTADSTLYQNRVEFAAQGRSFQNPAFAASLTPDPFAAEVFAPGALTANVTINNPVLAGTNTTGLFLVPGMRLVVILTQDGTGGRTVTWGAAFKLNGKAINGAANASTVFSFFYDGTSWQCQA